MALKIKNAPTQAQKVLGQIETIVESSTWRDSDPRRALQLLHAEAFSACVQYSEEECGWGPARAYKFADGSTLTDDGRGYTCD